MDNLQQVEVALGKTQRWFREIFHQILIVLMNPMGILKLGSSPDEGEITNAQFSQF